MTSVLAEVERVGRKMKHGFQMNYRRGFQRLYAAICAAYAALFLWNAPSHQLKFWTEDDWDEIAKDYDLYSARDLEARLSASRRAGYSNDQVINILNAGASIDISAARRAGYSDHQIISYLYALYRRDKLPPEKQAVVEELSRRFNETLISAPRLFAPVGTVRFSHSRAGKSLWIVCYLVLLPGLLYLLFFHVSKWVYLGFRPGVRVL